MPDSKFIPAQLRAGIKVESEHTNSRAIAKQIAKAHLVEQPRYYSYLDKMEKSWKQTKHLRRSKRGKLFVAGSKIAKRQYVGADPKDDFIATTDQHGIAHVMPMREFRNSLMKRERLQKSTIPEWAKKYETMTTEQLIEKKRAVEEEMNRLQMEADRLNKLYWDSKSPKGGHTKEGIENSRKAERLERSRDFIMTEFTVFSEILAKRGIT
jgi:hypothetical protein